MKLLIWEQGAQNIAQGSRKQLKIKSSNGARRKGNHLGAKEEMKREQGAKGNEKGAVEFAKKEREARNRGTWGMK